jgi:hypothetical protein
MSWSLITSNEGLTHERRESHDILNGNRVTGSVFQYHAKLNLPLFLTPELWERHRYTLSDITNTLQSYPVLCLWQCALLFDIKLSNSAVRASCASSESMIFTSKSVVIKKITKYVSEHMGLGQISVIDVRDSSHCPPIPKHAISKHRWDALACLTPTNTVDMLQTLYYDGYFEWRNTKFVPLYVNNNCICSMRIVTFDIYSISGRPIFGSMTHKPVDVNIANVHYCGVDEMCLFSLEN